MLQLMMNDLVMLGTVGGGGGFRDEAVLMGRVFWERDELVFLEIHA